MANEKYLIVVLGMHRSGTSAITRGLEVLGVSLGERLMPAIENINARGFWEDIDLNSLNIEMLKAIGSDWFYLAPINAGDINKLHKEGYFLRAVELLREKVCGVPIFGFKDPRVAKLLPFWKEVFDHCQFNVKYVLAMRHPLSVVRSLAKRDGFVEEHSYLLWLGHTLESWAGSAGKPRVLVDYDRMMQSPDAELMRMAKALSLKIDDAELQNYKTKFLDESLRHTKYDYSDLLSDIACPAIVQEVYSTLLDVGSGSVLTDNSELSAKISCWVAEFARLKSALVLADKLLSQKANMSRDVTERDSQITDLNRAITERDGQIANLNQAVIERDSQITNLNRAITECDDQTASLNQAVTGREAHLILQLNELRAATEMLMLENEKQRMVADMFQGQLAQIYQSRSWRITAPLRKLSSLQFEFLRKRQLLAHSEHISKLQPVQTIDLIHNKASAVTAGAEYHEQDLAETDTACYRILLVSYYCPTRAHAGGLRILDMYALLKRMCPEVQLDLFTHLRPQIDWSIDEVHSIFDNVYICENEDLAPDAFIASLPSHSVFYDVVDLQFHQSAYHIAAYRKIGHKILFTPMESQAKILFLEIQEHIRHTRKVSLRKFAALSKMAWEEISFCRKSDTVVCVSKTDAAFIRAMGGGRHVREIETGLSPFEFSNALSDNFVPPRCKDRSKSIIYVAYFGSETNVKALEWFLVNVHPHIVKAVPGYKLLVVGRGDLTAFQSYADASVELVGEVPVLEPYIRDANHGIAPALGGAGFRGKINQYAILGIPAVTSRIAHKGFVYRDGHSILVADAPEDFAQCCIRLLQDDKLNDMIAVEARRLCIETYGWQSKWPSIAAIYGVKDYVR